jgi:hypothetical protein
MSQLPGNWENSTAIGIAFIKTTQGTNRFLSQALVAMREDIKMQQLS